MIRKAIEQDYKQLIRHCRNLPDYMSKEQLSLDIACGNLYIMEVESKIIAICSLVYDTNYNYFAIKRLKIFNKKNNGRGYAQLFIEYFLSLDCKPLGCTPWEDNKPMIHILEKCGFKYQYTFNKKWLYYRKEVES